MPMNQGRDAAHLIKSRERKTITYSKPIDQEVPFKVPCAIVERDERLAFKVLKKDLCHCMFTVRLTSMQMARLPLKVSQGTFKGELETKGSKKMSVIEGCPPSALIREQKSISFSSFMSHLPSIITRLSFRVCPGLQREPGIKMELDDARKTLATQVFELVRVFNEDLGSTPVFEFVLALNETRGFRYWRNIMTRLADTAANSTL